MDDLEGREFIRDDEDLRTVPDLEDLTLTGFELTGLTGCVLLLPILEPSLLLTTIPCSVV
jgi:hypothetical protein